MHARSRSRAVSDAGKNLLLWFRRCAWLRLLDRPDLAQNTFEIAAENSFDVPIAVLSPDQSLCQIEHPLRVIQTFDIALFTKTVTSFVTCSQLLVEFRRH